VLAVLGFDMHIIFRPLQPGDEAGLDHAQREMAREDYAFAFDYEPGQDFALYLQVLEDKRCGRNLRAGSVPATFEIGVLDGRIVARLSVRHALNEFLLQQGGHIGYAVLSEFRRRGVGSACLRRGLEIAKSLGLSSVLVTCDDDNPVSRRIIEKAGALYESSYVGPDALVPVRRYWLEP
jgi:predicted acetyltransferase